MRTLLSSLAMFLALTLAGCKHAPPPATAQDHPRLTPDVVLRDVTFHSAALGRDVTYRAVLPKTIAPDQKLPVIYLLHGGGGNFHDWSNYTDIDAYAARGYVLVMPEGGSSYYMNAVKYPQDKYEDFIVHDLIADVEQRFPAAAGREHRAIAGVSMGGFGAVVLAMRHPELFAFAAGISPALDVPSRSFSFRHWGQWWDHRAIFGPMESATRLSEDPYELAKRANPLTASYLYLSCGDREALLAPNLKFTAQLQHASIPFEFHKVLGGFHTWEQWSARVPGMMDTLSRHVR